MEQARAEGAKKGPRVVDSLRPRKNRQAAPIGGVFILLAALGFAALAFLCVRFTQSLLDNSGEKQMFQRIITPVMMFDPVPFDDVTKADNLFLLQSSMWSTLLGEKRESYAFDEMDRAIVPASDMDVACARLFGPDVKLVHQSFGDVETNNVYDEATRSYYVPVRMQALLYTASVERVVKSGDVYELLVGYIPPAQAWTQSLDGSAQSSQREKYMQYDLIQVRDHYQLIAIRDVEGGVDYSGTGNVKPEDVLLTGELPAA